MFWCSTGFNGLGIDVNWRVTLEVTYLVRPGKTFQNSSQHVSVGRLMVTDVFQEIDEDTGFQGQQAMAREEQGQA